MKKTKIIAVKTDKLWLPVEGFPEYECNRYGEFRRWHHQGRKIKKPIAMRPFKKAKRPNPAGTLYIHLRGEDGKRHEVTVHGAMARTWFRNIPKDYVCYHKNGVISDNSVYNLGFTTRQELGRMSAIKTMSGPHQPKEVIKVDREGNIVDFYKSVREAGRANHAAYQTISDRCNKIVKRDEFALFGGYTFRYSNTTDKWIRRIE